MTIQQWMLTTIPGIIILGALGSLVAAAAAHLIGKRLFPFLRRYAERMPRSITRVLFYQMLVASIRGRTHQSQVVMLSVLFLGACGYFAIWAGSEVKVGEEQLTRLEQMRSQFSSTRRAEPPSTMTTLKEIDELEPQIRTATRWARYQSAIIYVAWLYWGIWTAYFIMLRSVAFEFERLMVRLPGVVTKDEFRSLCRLEMDVTDRKNLVPFLRELHRLTSHYQLSTIFGPIEFSNIAEMEGGTDASEE